MIRIDDSAPQAGIVPRSAPLLRALTCLTVCLTFTLLAAAQGDEKPERLDGKQRAQVDRWIRELRTEKDQLARMALVDQILVLGPAASRRLFDWVESDLAKASDRYGKALAKAAEKRLRKQTGKKEKIEIDRLRGTVTALRRKKNLHSGDIATVADPALARLRELLLPTAATVAGESKELTASRKHIQELSRYLVECRSSLQMKVDEEGKRLEKLESRAMVIPLYNAAGQIKVLEANDKTAPEIDPAEAEGIFDLNRTRLLLGLSSLRTDVKLCLAARDHSKDMRTKSFFSHSSPVPGKATPWARARNFGTAASAENIYAGSRSGIDANISWYYSPGHHKNMLNPGFRVVGVGCSEKHWTQMFR